MQPKDCKRNIKKIMKERDQSDEALKNHRDEMFGIAQIAAVDAAIDIVGGLVEAVIDCIDV